MNSKFFWLLFTAGLMITSLAETQVELKTGMIYGVVTDEQKVPLPGVLVHLESDVTTPQTALTGLSGSFRFANLPPGNYSSFFSIDGYTQVKQENIRVATGTQVHLSILMKPSLTEEVTVIGETPLLDSRKTGNFEVFNQEYLKSVPSAHDPWSILDQTAGIDSSRYEVTQQGVQSQFVSRGSYGGNFVYDGINVSDPAAAGASGVYFDFEAFEEIQVNTTGGVSINMVTKRGGNRWAGNASYYYSGQGLQSTNTPSELVARGLEDQSNRLDQMTEYGFDLGGPLITDKLFAWGAYRKYNNDVFTINNLPDSTELEDVNFKTNFNWTSGHESQFNYFLSIKNKAGRGFDIANQAPETLWDQGNVDSLFPGIIAVQHTWTPNDHAIITGRYSYLPIGFQLVPRGGNDVPMILLAQIGRYENTGFYVSPIERPTHDVSVDVNLFKEHWTGGDHEFKFGFNYRTANVHTFSSYGNGVMLIDYYQTVPEGLLTSGYAIAQHYIDGKVKNDYVDFLVNDTFRSNRLTLTLGLTYTRSSGKNLQSSIPGVPGFESYVGPFNYPGGDPGIVFNTFSPQIGATYDLTGDGKTLLRANFDRFYDAYGSYLASFSNPTFTYNGAALGYVNRNGDRNITSDEIVAGPYYYGGLDSPNFDLNAFLAKRQYDKNLSPGWANDFIVGVEREIISNTSVAVTYTHRDYGNQIVEVPSGISGADYVPGGTFEVDTSLGNFSVPYFVLGKPLDGTRLMTNLKGYKQSYNGVDFIVKKRMSNNFMLNGSFTLQRQNANYEGGNSLGQNARVPVSGSRGVFPAFDPTSIPFLNAQPYTAMTNLYSEWQLKLNGVYMLPWAFNVGGSLKYQQGYPFTLVGTVDDPALSAFYSTRNHYILVEPFGNRRYDNLLMLDLQFDKTFAVAQLGRVTLAANIFNVTNANTVLRRNNLVNVVKGGAPALNPKLNAIEGHLAPRAWRFGIRYNF